MKKLFALGALAMAGVLAMGCAEEKSTVVEDFSDLSAADDKSDAFSRRMRIVGSLDYGQTSAPVAYRNPPQYRAFKFAGDAGDQVVVDVRSGNGDALAWVLDDSFRILAHNDDFGGSLDSHIEVTLTANTRVEIRTYYVVFRDYWMDRATFTVQLAKVAGTCDYDGQIYSEGDSFPSSDGCNTCFCGADGGVGCTKRACAAPTCEYGGVLYAEGDSFPSSDGCNTCSCTSSGVACTERACAPNWNKNYVGTPDQCRLIRYTCVEGTTHFSDAQGCGCEQPSDCPEWISCLPPTNCSAERARCPLSQVAW